MTLRDLRLGAGPDDGENLRRIGRSLSGTVVTSRRGRLTATRSFVSVTSCALLPPCGRAVKLHQPECVVTVELFHIPVLYPPAVCLISPFCAAFQPVLLSLLLLPLSKVKQADVSASACLLPLF